MAEELERTCENCRYEHEDMESTHCRHCIHNATENFEPKEIELSEQEIREKAIDEFAERLHELCGYEEDGFQYPYLLHESRIDEIAEQMKAGAENERL